LSLSINYFLVLKSYLHSRHFLAKVGTEYTELSPVNAGIPQGSVLGPLLYLLHTADLPTSPKSTTATFANDPAVLATDIDPAIASQKLQKPTCPAVHINNMQLPQDVNYLGLHLDRRLTSHKHIFAKWKQLGIAITKMYWLLRH
jgi:hypothetical protein